MLRPGHLGTSPMKHIGQWDTFNKRGGRASVLGLSLDKHGIALCGLQREVV